MAESVADGWHYLRSGAPAEQQVGPLTWDQLRGLSSSGALGASDLVWHATLPQWLPVVEVQGLAPAGEQPLGTVRSVLSMILNPGEVIKGALQGASWPVCLTISGLAFTLFFLQTSLDMHRVGTAGTGAAVGYTFLGLGVGTIGVGLVAALAWLLARPLGCTRSLEWTVRAFCLAYTSTLVFAVVGLIFNLAAGWNTAVAFGITGALWAFHPLLSILKEMTGQKLVASLVLATVCGSIIISMWAAIGL